MAKKWFHNCIVSEIRPDPFLQCFRCADTGVDMRVRESMSDGKDGVTTHDTYFHQRCFVAQHPDLKKFQKSFTKFRVTRIKENQNE